MVTNFSERITGKSSWGENGCIEFNGFRNKYGYGVINIGGKNQLVHRVAYEEFVGKIPDGVHVCHTCDNPSCWNTDHLFLGTPQDNMSDKVSKDRQRKGADVVTSKLSESDVLEIKDLLEKGNHLQKEIARKFSINQSQVSYIKNGKYWKHLNKKEF